MMIVGKFIKYSIFFAMYNWFLKKHDFITVVDYNINSWSLVYKNAIYYKLKNTYI